MLSMATMACGTIAGGAIGAGSGAAIGAGTGYGAKKGACRLVAEQEPRLARSTTFCTNLGEPLSICPTWT